jgi:hypothetical protein
LYYNQPLLHRAHSGPELMVKHQELSEDW